METTQKVDLQKLESDTRQWVDQTFNQVSVYVLEKVCDNALYEFIEPMSNEDYALEWYNSLDEDIDMDPDISPDDAEFGSWLCEKYEDDIRLWIDANSYDDNYPMWNTCFEFKESAPDLWQELAVKAGFGIINPIGNDEHDYFNTTLFVAGAGYSFYAAHWIPLFLSMPWNEELSQQLTKKDYEHL